MRAEQSKIEQTNKQKERGAPSAATLLSARSN